MAASVKRGTKVFRALFKLDQDNVSDKVFLTLDLQEAEKPNVQLKNEDEHGRITFRGRAKSHALGQQTHDYDLDLKLYGAVDQDSSKISVTARHIVLVIAKKSGAEGFWPRLTLDKSKQPNIKVDWDKWVDEDEEDDKVDPTSQFDLDSLSNFSNFEGGAGGMPGGLEGALGGAGLGGEGLKDDEDSDEEDLPDLEKA